MYIKGEKEMPACGFSNQVVQIFKQFNVPFETRNVLANEDLRSSIKEYSNWPTVPQIFINGEFVGGCDIVTEMFQSGELKPLIEKISKK
jgi:monothiol glutaredoxin